MLPILLALAFVALLLVIAVAGQPDEFSISRRIKIAAPAHQVFPHINELRNWEAWNPWAKLDPLCQMTYDGPPAGIGASYAWNGNNKIGAGRNTITESRPDELVRLKLEFLRPMAATNTAEFAFQPNDGQTIVTWTMSGKRNAGGKIFGLLLNCDQMIGGQFDKGLAQMKSVVETTG
jgi:polyketide cyclase/dehydrase/lipid transport protein